MLSMFATLSQRRLRWLGHVCRMDDGRIPKDILYGELATGTRPTGQPALRYKDVCKRDLKSCNINPADLETAISERNSWSASVITGIKRAEEKRGIQHEERKSRKQQRTQPTTAPPIVPTMAHICSKCGRSCSSRIGLFSHMRRCCPTAKFNPCVVFGSVGPVFNVY